MSEIGLSLQGQFKFDLYDKNRNLLKSSDYINNFITKSGISFPYHFAFADCFRFLSVGSGNDQNSLLTEGLIKETTGLSEPIPEFSYIGSRSDFDSLETTKYSFDKGCGYRFPSPNIVELYREWTLPNNLGGDEGAFQNNGTFKEFMVTPGRPYVVTNLGEKLCSCNDKSGIYSGLDCSSIAEYYNWVNKKSKDLDPINRKMRICEADKAFARIVLENAINYNSGDILNVTYKLSININSGINFKSLRSQDPINGNWNGKLNSISNITNPGIKLINDGEIKNPIMGPKNIVRLQHYDYDNSERLYFFEKEYGESFVPPHGIPLEPSNLFLDQNEDLRNIVYYLSEDNTQFLVTSSGGKFLKTGEYAPWNIYIINKIYYSGDYVYSGNNSYQYININPESGKLLNNTSYWKNLNILRVVEVSNSGLKLFKNDVEKAINNPDDYWQEEKNEFNIRISGSFPKTGDITEQDTNPKLFYFSPGVSKPIFNFDSRTGKVSYVFNFKNYSPNILYSKNLVASYKDINYANINSNYNNYVPFFDLIFSGTGNVFIPKIITGIQDYGVLEKTGAFISGSNDENYFYLGGGVTYPIFTNILSWSAPCPQSVYGCS